MHFHAMPISGTLNGMSTRYGLFHTGNLGLAVSRGSRDWAMGFWGFLVTCCDLHHLHFLTVGHWFRTHGAFATGLRCWSLWLRVVFWCLCWGLIPWCQLQWSKTTCSTPLSNLCTLDGLGNWMQLMYLLHRLPDDFHQWQWELAALHSWVLQRPLNR